MKSKSAKPDTKNVDPIFQKYGAPFLVNSKGKVSINDRAVAVKCATQHGVTYNALAKGYERYDNPSGLWVSIHETEVMRLLDDLLIELGKQYKQVEVTKRITAAKLAALCKMLRPYDAGVQGEDVMGKVHVKNGVLQLDRGDARLLSHDARYAFHHSGNVTYDKKAACTKFLKEFLGEALEPDDIRILKMYCGSMLLGPNSCHGIMVIRGTPGGGKSTLVSIIEQVLGENNVAYLRTGHLNGRFETSAFLGKRLLVGKDVPGDTLAVSGARMLKSLVGGDLMQAEVKFNPNKQAIRGDYHVMIVSNNKLRIALDGDEDAWRRRLLVVDFKNPKPTRPIPNFAAKLVKKEASGILNWLIEGAVEYRAQMEKHGTLCLNEEQQQRVDMLLENSDSVAQFVRQSVVPKVGKDVSTQELLLGYYRRCDSRDLTPVASQAFFTRVPDLLAQMFKTIRRNDINREGKAVRGFKGLALNA